MTARRDPDREAFSRAVARNLRRLVADDGRSVRELERDCGVANGTAYNLMRGRTGVNLITAVRLCDGLGCGLDDLVGDAGARMRPMGGLT